MATKRQKDGNLKSVEQAAEKAGAAEPAGPVSERLEQAREKFSEVADGVGKKVRHLGEGAEKAGKEARARAEQASAAAREKYGVASEKVKAGYDKARKDLDTLTHDVNDYVRDNPGRAVLIAGGIGFVLGMLLRGGRRD